MARHVVLAVGECLEHRRPRTWGPIGTPGMYSVAARRTPSVISMETCSLVVMAARVPTERGHGVCTPSSRATGGQVQPRNQTRAFHIVSLMRLAVRMGHIHRNSPTAAAK